MKKFALAALSFFAPALAFAQSPTTRVDSLQSLASWAIGFINVILVPLVFALSFIFFIWGVFNYFIRGAADAEKRATGGQFMLYGLIGFFVMISVWGLVHVLTGTFNFNNYTPSQNNDLPVTPQIH